MLQLLLKSLRVYVIIFYSFFLISIEAYGQKPVIDNISKASAAPGDVISINGSGFSTNASNLKIWFGASFGEITSSTENTIDVKVPAGATFDKITVYNLISGLSDSYESSFIPSFGGKTFDAGKLNEPVFFNADKGLYDLCMCDFDGDGKNDIAAANNNSTSVTFFRNTSSPTTPVSFQRIDKNIFSTTINTTCGDLDGDGKAEVIFSKKDGDRIFVLRNTSTVGNITFAAALAVPTDGNNTRKLKLKDLDGDGKLDIILTNQSNNMVYVFQNKSTKGNLIFATHKKFEVLEASKLTGLSVEDFDGDGLPDIVVNPLLESNIYILKNKSISGNINFDPSLKIEVAGALVNTSTGDFNNDGKPDIVVSKYTSNYITVFLNETAGANSVIKFSEGKNFASSNGCWGIDVGDIDGDGLPDLAVTSIDDTKNLTIFRNSSASGVLNFDKYVVIVPQKSFTVEVGDIDGDGKPDFSFTGIDETDISNKLTVIRNVNCMVPVLSSENPLVFCSGSSVKINATNGIGVTYSWTKDEAEYPVSDPKVSSITSTTSGTYKVTATIGSCVQTSNSLILSLGSGTTPPTPTVTAATKSVCSGETLTLGVNSPIAVATYFWKGPSSYASSGSSATINIPNVSSEHAGKYYVSVKVGDCQSEWAETSVQVSNISSYNIAASGPLTLCSGKSVTLSVNNTTGNTYIWKKNGVIISGETTNSITETTEGSYSVVITNIQNCTFEAAPAVIKIVTPPTASFNMPTSICKDTKVSIQNTSLMANNTTPYYIWTFGDGKSSALKDPENTYSTTGDYSVKLIAHYDDATCKSEVSKTIKVVPAPTVSITSLKAEACEGDSIELKLNGTYSSVSWSTNATSNTIFVKQSGNYSVNATTSAGCTASSNITVNFLPAPQIKITANRTSISQGESVRLSATGGFNYSWSPAETIESPASDVTVASPSTTTIYKLRGEDINGCSAFDSIRIDVDVRINVNPPKFFTPNADNKNDKFFIGNIEEYPECAVIIFNRQGHKLFEAKPYNVNNAWDGTSNGKNLMNGVYYYVIRCGSSDNNIKSGTVTLIK